LEVAAGCWLLAAGCWLLAAGCWLLGSNYSLLAVWCLLADNCSTVSMVVAERWRSDVVVVRYRSGSTHVRMKRLLEIMKQKRAVLFLGERHTTLIDNAIYYCNPPEHQAASIMYHAPTMLTSFTYVL
jgi:hypothetical protein